MATQPTRPGEDQQVDEDLKRVLDEHLDAAEKETDRVSRKQLLEEGLRKLKTPARH